MSLVVLGCEGPVAPTDTSPSRLDAALVCDEDSDCEDGVFCNGRETCEPARGTRDGCVPGAPPCDDPARCIEAETRCMASCAEAPDRDGDGHAAIECGGDDCDDDDSARFPENPEVCDDDDHDEDCDDTTFGDRDADRDGFVDHECCNAGACGDDCDDARNDVHPGLPELCDRVDTDCDERIDEGSTITCWTDADADRYAPADATSVMTCECPVRTTTMGPEPGLVDCDDARAASSPEGSEVCNGLDDDCDGSSDEGVLVSCWVDADGDGYAPLGATEMRVCSCTPGSTTPRAPTASAHDCLDSNAAVSPVGTEGCVANGLDDDCDGTPDGADLMGDNWYRDCDLDGYGASGTTPIRACDPPGTVPPACGGGGGWAPNLATDCDDSRAAVRPGTAPGDSVPAELCDGLDNDCNPSTGDGRSEAWFGAACDGADGDFCAEGTLGCGPGGVQRVCSDPVGETDLEACGGGDEDCDGTTDEAAGTNVWCDARVGSLPHATDATCAMGVCIPSACASGWYDCNDSGLGCESACQWAGCTTPRTTGTCADPIRVSAAGGSSIRRTCAVRRDGRVACWGQLASGSTSTPIHLALPAGQTAIDVDDWCVLFASGGVGQTSSSSASVTPFLPGLFRDVTRISCGGRASCALRSDSTVYCAGAGSALGIGSASDSGSHGQVVGLSDATDIAVGAYHACALRSTGQVVCWGLNNFGQLGDGVATHSTCSIGDCALTPVTVTGLTDAREIAAGFIQTCARRATGEVVCWGQGNDLGTGSSSHGETCPGWGTPVDCARRPTLVPGASPAVALEASTQRQGACVVRSGSGQVACWTNGTTPTAVTGLTSPSDLATAGGVGEIWTCAIDAGGLRCVGDNGYGQLGDGTLTDRTMPVLVVSPP